MRKKIVLECTGSGKKKTEVKKTVEVINNGTASRNKALAVTLVTVIVAVDRTGGSFGCAQSSVQRRRSRVRDSDRTNTQGL